jgi:large conductance mechanosensitive channel
MFKRLEGFVEFVREQGVVGLAIGLVIGTSVKELVDSLVKSFIDPLIGLFVPNVDSLPAAKFSINGQDFMWGAFVSVLIRFIAIAAVIYFVLRSMKLDKLDRKKDAAAPVVKKAKSK